MSLPFTQEAMNEVMQSLAVRETFNKKVNLYENNIREE